MEQFLIYLLKVNGLLIFFWIFYKLLLQKETFYTFNRFYFLGSTLMSFVLPLIYFTKIKEIIVPASNFQIVENKSNFLIERPEIIELKWHETIDWLLVIVILIAVISVIKVGIQIFKIVQLTNSIQKLEKHPTEKIIRITENDEHVYSFYKWIILPKKLLNSENCSVLIQHEKVHIKQKHTFDLVSLSFISDFFWFNPIIKWIIKDVNLNLEFLVDDEITKQENSYSYQKTLLNFNQNQEQNIITNAFNSSDLKQRILMLNTKKSNHMKKLKIALTAPALLAFFGLFQIETVAQVKTEASKKEIEVEEIYEVIPTFEIYEEVVALETNEYDKNDESFYIMIHNAYDDSYYSDMTKNLKKAYNLDVEVSDLKRNKNGELTSIKITCTDENQIFKRQIKPIGENSFEPFKLHVYKENNKYYIENSSATTNEIAKIKGKFSFDLESSKTDEITPVFKGKFSFDEENEQSKNQSYKITSEAVFKETNGTDLLDQAIEYFTASLNIPFTPGNYEMLKNKNIVFTLDGKEITDLSKIDKNNIEWCSYQKGEFAISTYGEKAKNGAFNITTKKKTSKKQNSTKENQNALIEKEKNFEMLSSIFYNTKEIKKVVENDDLKITSISASLTQEDGTKITMSENY